jgi:serine/threonine protein kinase
MIKTLTNITEISVVDQNTTNNLYSFSKIEFDDNAIGAGGFGTVFKLFSIDGKLSTGYVLKIYTDEVHKLHAFNAIQLLHDKIKHHQHKTGIPVYHEFPEFLGMPFLAFKGFDSISNTNCVAFIMYDLTNLGYQDYGADNFARSEFNKLLITDKIYIAYQLAKAADYLHSIDFIHADLNEQSLFFNQQRLQIAIIDYDSGFHYDIQAKPSTLGKISQWIGGGFRNIIGQKLDSSSLTIKDRISEEYWIIANAIFEIIFGIMPYFFLEDADDKTKKDYLKEFEWPNIDYSSDLFNKSSEESHKQFVNLFNQFESTDLNEIMIAFKTIFNKGYGNDKKRLSASQWKKLLFDLNMIIDNQPNIKHFKSGKSSIQRKNESVKLSWTVSKFNALFINNELVPLNTNSITIKLDRASDIILKASNDFFNIEEKIRIKELRVEPIIIEFTASDYVRKSLKPITLSWKTKNATKVYISPLNDEYQHEGQVEVSPIINTKYVIKAIGSFDEVVEKSLTVEISNPKIKKFYFEVNLNEGIDNIDLIWETSDAESVSINPKIGKVSDKGLRHISIRGKTEFTLVAANHFSSIEQTIEAYPFPVPIIETIFVTAPEFNISTSLSIKGLNPLPRVSFQDIPEINIGIKNYNYGLQINMPHFVLNAPLFIPDKHSYLAVQKKNYIVEFGEKIQKLIGRLKKVK